MDLRTRQERQRDRIEVTLGVVLILGAIAFGALFVVSRTTNVFEQVPTPTATVLPTATVNPNMIPLTFELLQFTDRLSYGDTLWVEVFTDRGTQCRIQVSFFSLIAGNYQNVILADLVTDSTGRCLGQLLITSAFATGEHVMSVSLRNGSRSEQARWTFEVTE